MFTRFYVGHRLPGGFWGGIGVGGSRRTRQVVRTIRIKKARHYGGLWTVCLAALAIYTVVTFWQWILLCLAFIAFVVVVKARIKR